MMGKISVLQHSSCSDIKLSLMYKPFTASPKLLAVQFNQVPPQYAIMGFHLLCNEISRAGSYLMSPVVSHVLAPPDVSTFSQRLKSKSPTEKGLSLARYELDRSANCEESVFRWATTLWSTFSNQVLDLHNDAYFSNCMAYFEPPKQILVEVEVKIRTRKPNTEQTRQRHVIFFFTLWAGEEPLATAQSTTHQHSMDYKGLWETKGRRRYIQVVSSELTKRRPHLEEKLRLDQAFLISFDVLWHEMQTLESSNAARK